MKKILHSALFILPLAMLLIATGCICAQRTRWGLGDGCSATRTGK